MAAICTPARVSPYLESSRGAALTTNLVRIVSIPTNPVPAAVGVAQQSPAPDKVWRIVGNGLRIQNDHIVGI